MFLSFVFFFSYFVCWWWWLRYLYIKCLCVLYFDECTAVTIARNSRVKQVNICVVKASFRGYWRCAYDNVVWVWRCCLLLLLFLLLLHCRHVCSVCWQKRLRASFVNIFDWINWRFKRDHKRLNAHSIKIAILRVQFGKRILVANKNKFIACESLLIFNFSKFLLRRIPE